MQFRIRDLAGLAPGIDDDRPLWTQLIQVEADCLADAPLDAIPQDRLSDGARQGEADARTGRLGLADAERREQGA